SKAGSQGGNSVVLLQALIDRRQGVNRHRRVMPHLAHLADGRENLVEMAAPAGRILALGVAAHLAPVPYPLNPAATTARRDRLGATDSVQIANDCGRANGTGRQVAYDRAGVGL